MEENEDIIYLNSIICEVYAKMELTQYFINPFDSPIELSISFPIKEEINLIKFIITIGEKVILSKILPKEKAEEKYNDSISSGNTGFISSYDSQMTNYSVNIGNINPKQKIKLNTVFIQMTGAQDMSYEYNIMEKYPTFHCIKVDKYLQKDKIIKANFKIEAQSKITRLIAPFLDEEAKKKLNYEVNFSNEFKTADIKYTKNPGDKINTNKHNFYSSFCLLFRTQKMNEPILFYQYNPELKESSYSINYVYSSKNLKQITVPSQPDQDNKISYYSKYQDNAINDSPGLFIFLIDQSGSMRGKSIDLVKQSLLLFIQSIPPGSYFQLIGFGTDFQKYNEEPVEYNQKNMNEIINKINELEANMGGTNISRPLYAIYKDKSYTKINLSKNIFLLTDGQVFDREECVNLITTNSNKFRIHALGIGNDFDKVLIEQSGKLGKGSSSYVENVENINSAVIDTLNKSLRPYLIDIQFNFNNYQNNISNSVLKCNPINNFTYQDETMNYSFILDDKNNFDINNLSEPINIEITARDPKNVINNNVFFKNEQNIVRLPDGDEMSKMIVGKSLKNNKELTDDVKKEVELAKKYQLLSKNTAFFAEILNDVENQNKLIKVNLNKYEKHEKLYRGISIGGHERFRSRLNKSLSYRACASTESYIKKNVKTTYFYFSGENNRKSNGNRNIILLAVGVGLITLLGIKRSLLSFGIICVCLIIYFYFHKLKNTKKEKNIKNIKKEKFENKNNEKSNVNEFRDELIKLIMSQDIIEGSWKENNETRKLEKNISKDVYDKIINNVKALNKGTEEMKIIYTLLVIYFLNTKHADKLNDYKLIINKGKKYLISQGVKYEEIIT